MNTLETRRLRGEACSALQNEILSPEFFSVDQLPNLVRHLVSAGFWSDQRSRCPFTHILRKSLPQRCQVRNLISLIASYSAENDEFCDWLRLCTLCSAAGLYPGNRCLDLRTRRRIFSFFDMTPLQFQLWLKDGHQSLCLFVVKEYLCWCAQGSTAVQEELCHRYKWGAFRTSVAKAMEQARKMIEEEKSFGQVDAYLLGINRSQVKHMFRQRKNTFVECLDALVQKEVVAEGAWGVYQIVIRADEGDFSWLPVSCREALLKVQEEYARSFARSNLKALVRGIPPSEQALLRLYINMVKRSKAVRIFNLPSCWRAKQVRAVCRMYRVEEEGDLPSHAGKCALCHECKSFKSFVSNPRFPRSLCCYGHSKVLVDDDTLKLYCGRKHDRRGENTCERTEIVEVSLVGRILAWWGSLYTICPKCGNFMKFDPRYHAGGVYCGLCMEDGILKSEHKCEWCHSKKNLSRVCTVEKPIRLCRQCYRPWIRTATTLLPLDTIRRGLRNKWKTLPG